MEAVIAAVQPFVGPAVLIGLMLLMHRGHGGHSQHRSDQEQTTRGARGEAAALGSHQHD